MFQENKENFVVAMLQHHYDPETKNPRNEWRHSRSPPPRKYKVVTSALEGFDVCVFWMAKE